MCVFNFFFWKSWLAGEGDHLLQKKKLKVGFCGCSDTRRAFSCACIAKCAYHKPFFFEHKFLERVTKATQCQHPFREASPRALLEGDSLLTQLRGV